MDNPTKILHDALEVRGLTMDEIILVMAGLPDLGMLDMAEWIINRPMPTWQEMMKEKVRLIKKYLL